MQLVSICRSSLCFVCRTAAVQRRREATSVCNGLCPPGMGVSLRGPSPPWKDQRCETTYNHQRRASASPRGGVRWIANPRADEQKRSMRLSPRGDPAQDGEAHRSAGQGKRRGCAGEVHVLVRGDLLAMRIGQCHGSRTEDRVGRRVSDRQLLRLIGRYLRAGVWTEDKLLATTQGVPQGGLCSPLLTNIIYGEPPRADPHAGWRGGRGRETPGYPIIRPFSSSCSFDLP